VDFRTADIGHLKEIYASYAKRFSGTVVRDNDNYWKQWIANEPAVYYALENKVYYDLTSSHKCS
jgi:hypothetical protein